MIEISEKNIGEAENKLIAAKKKLLETYGGKKVWGIGGYGPVAYAAEQIDSGIDAAESYTRCLDSISKIELELSNGEEKTPLKVFNLKQAKRYWQEALDTLGKRLQGIITNDEPLLQKAIGVPNPHGVRSVIEVEDELEAAIVTNNPVNFEEFIKRSAVGRPMTVFEQQACEWESRANKIIQGVIAEVI